MNEIIKTNTAVAGTLTNDLYEAFIDYIGRGEATTRTYIINLRQFAAWLSYNRIEQPERNDIKQYMAWLSSEHETLIYDNGVVEKRTDRAGNVITLTCKANTIRGYMQAVKRFFKWTAANGFYPNVADNIHPPKAYNDTHKKLAFTAEQVKDIETLITQQVQESTTATAKEQNSRLLAMFNLAVNCGLRTIELSRAKIHDLHITGSNVVLYVWGKGHSEPDQKVFIPQEVHESIKAYLATRSDKYNGNSYLFVSTGNRSGGKQIAETTISKMLKQAMKSAGYDSELLTAHSLRHTTGTTALNITNDIYTAQKLLRHSSPATTELYINEGEKETRKTASLAQSIYDKLHGVSANDSEQLLNIVAMMNSEQLRQLVGIAAAIAN